MKIDKEILFKLIENRVGPEALPLTEIIVTKDNISEFKIADKLQLTVNQVRNILYKLHEHNLVSFTRKKDKRKGWYIYYWTLNKNRAFNMIFDMKKERLSQLRHRLEREQTTDFFTCPQKCIRLSFETAMDHQFKCPECGSLLVQQSNVQDIEKIKKEIIQLEEEIKQDEEERFKKAEQKVKRADRKEAREKIKKKKLKKATKKTKPIPKKKTKKKLPKKKKINKKSISKKNSKKKSKKKIKQSKKKTSKKKKH